MELGIVVVQRHKKCLFICISDNDIMIWFIEYFVFALGMVCIYISR